MAEPARWLEHLNDYCLTLTNRSVSSSRHRSIWQNFIPRRSQRRISPYSTRNFRDSPLSSHGQPECATSRPGFLRGEFTRGILDVHELETGWFARPARSLVRAIPE